MRKILVTGIGGPPSKATVRCLNLSDQLEVYGTDCNKSNLEFSEAKKSFLVPHSSDEKNYIKALNKIITSENIDFLLPHHDVEVYAISKNVDKIKCKTFLPSHSIINLCQDKTKLFKFLKEDVPLLYENELPTQFWMRAHKGVGGKGSIHIKDPKQVSAWKYLNPNITNWQCTEYLPGRNIGIDVIIKNGEIVDYQMKERIKYLPGVSMSGITGSAGISKVIHDSLPFSIAVLALKKIDKNLSGIFAVDMKQDSDEKWKITEINAGRFLTSSLVLFHLTKFNLPVKMLSLMFKDINYVGREVPLKDAIAIRQVDSLPKLI